MSEVPDADMSEQEAAAAICNKLALSDKVREQFAHRPRQPLSSEQPLSRLTHDIPRAPLSVRALTAPSAHSHTCSHYSP